MLASKKTRRGVIGAVVLASVLAVSGYALTDQITVPATHHAGDGKGAVEAQSVTSGTIKYTLGTGTTASTGPNVVTQIVFDLASTTALPATASIFVQPVSFGATLTPDTTEGTGNSTPGKWYSCTLATATATCDTSGTELDAADIDQLRVVSADS